MARYDISCLCGEMAQAVTLISSSGTTRAQLQLCHCDRCRRSTGQLCASYEDIERPRSSDGKHRNAARPTFERIACARCGCHVFQRLVDERGQETWSVATGTILGPSVGDDGTAQEGLQPYGAHVGVDDTVDGGLALWVREVGGRKMRVLGPQEAVCLAMRAKEPELVRACPEDNGSKESEYLYGACACGNVRFRISRPDETSRAPSSWYPDLMYPFCSAEQAKVANAEDEKWWLQPTGSNDVPTKYLAGTCACRSCRLASGFEIQSWAFVPRSNIFMLPSSADFGSASEAVPLDFTSLSAGVLKGYSSSKGTVREFCPKCYATVFWHHEDRAELMDVSVGLLQSSTGARAEDWLHWWRGRVSFAEEAGRNRTGDARRRAEALVQGLEGGMRSDAGT